MPDDVRLKEAARAKDLFEAKLWAGYLESEGIPTDIPNEFTADTFDGAAAIWTEGVPIHVSEPDLERARALLAERRRSAGDADQ